VKKCWQPKSRLRSSHLLKKA